MGYKDKVVSCTPMDLVEGAWRFRKDFRMDFRRGFHRDFHRDFRRDSRKGC